jgi:hypothetical protein
MRQALVLELLTNATTPNPIPGCATGYCSGITVTGITVTVHLTNRQYTAFQIERIDIAVRPID